MAKKARKNLSDILKDSQPIVLVRTYSAGVHFGRLVSRKGKEIELADARRVWRWYGANTLNEIAETGVDASRSRISQPTKRIILTEAIEIIDMAPEAVAIMEASPWATN